MCSTDPATDPAIMYCQNSRPSWVGGGDTDISVWNSGDFDTPRNFGEASVAMVVGGSTECRVQSAEWYILVLGFKRVNNWGLGIAFGLN